jgi:DNA-directed RNA polymerase specialized sigma24 family protein
MKNIPLEHFVTQHYDKIKRLAKAKAFECFINPGDFLSYVDLKLALVCSRGTFEGYHDLQFWGWFHPMLHNAMIDFKRQSSVINQPVELTDWHDFKKKEVQPDFELRDFLRKVRGEVKLKNTNYKVFNAHFMNGLKGEETAKLLHISHECVKASALRIRQLMNKKYGNEYKQIIAA